MINPAMQFFAISLSIAAILGFATVWVRQRDRARQFVHDRVHAATAGKDEVLAPRLSLLKLTRKTSVAVFQLPGKLSARLNAAFEASGNGVHLLHLIGAGFIAAIIVIAFASRVLSLNPGLVMPLGFIGAAAAPALVLRLAQSRFRNRFLNVFPDALDLVKRGVKAGLPVTEALAVAGREIGDPVGKELRRAVEDMQIGVQPIEAMQQVADRIRIPEFRFLVVALALQQRTGGSLAETLGNLSVVIRARKTLRLKVKSLSSEAKASAVILAIVPFVVAGAMYLMNPELGRMLFFDPRGRFMVGIAFLSLVSGLSVIVWLVKRAMR
jgi:tight adherence protein B